MHASPESASADGPGSEGPSAEVLIVGVNWLGDSIMTMPALQAYRRKYPQARLIMLVKPRLAPLWKMCPAIDEVHSCAGTLFEIPQAVGALRRRRIAQSFIFPHSLRSALIPFLARIPRRAGLSGHQRDWMLTDVVRPAIKQGREHQSYEYLDLMGLPDDTAEMPRLDFDQELIERVRHKLLSYDGKLLGLLPGAARGPAKRWPARFFAVAARELQAAWKCRIIIFGSSAEYALCARVAEGLGTSALNLAGQTSLPELAAWLSVCDLVIANDSGGMHLAAAAGVPVVAIFGVTDPAKTAPLTGHMRVLQNSLVQNRDLKPDSLEARRSMKRVSPQQVIEAALELVNGK